MCPSGCLCPLQLFPLRGPKAWEGMNVHVRSFGTLQCSTAAGLYSQSHSTRLKPSTKRAAIEAEGLLEAGFFGLVCQEKGRARPRQKVYKHIAISLRFSAC